MGGMVLFELRVKGGNRKPSSYEVHSIDESFRLGFE